MEFPVSGVEVAIWVPPAVAFAISVLTSLGGLSGAFLLLPFQMSVLGFTSPAVSATNHLYNVIATPAGVAGYVREGRMVWPIAWTVVAGTLPGVVLGAVVRVTVLPDPVRFKLFVGLVLLYIGVRTLAGARRRPGEAPSSGGKARRRHARVALRHASWRLIAYDFDGLECRFRPARLLVLSLGVGLIGGIYGIGGGAIIAPFLVTVLRLPVHTVAGAALLGTFATSLGGVVFYQALAPFHPELAVAPDWTLGLLFGLGGMAGTYLGARLQKRVPEGAIKVLLGAVLLALAMRYLTAHLG
jgi:uncharacterized protein